MLVLMWNRIMTHSYSKIQRVRGGEDFVCSSQATSLCGFRLLRLIRPKVQKKVNKLACFHQIRHRGHSSHSSFILFELSSEWRSQLICLHHWLAPLSSKVCHFVHLKWLKLDERKLTLVLCKHYKLIFIAVHSHLLTPCSIAYSSKQKHFIMSLAFKSNC